MTDEKKQHPVDHLVHPVGGIVLLAWSVLGILSVFIPWDGHFKTGDASRLASYIGFALLGVAARTPAGTKRRWLVRGWLAGLVTSVGVLVWAAAAGVDP